MRLIRWGVPQNRPGSGIVWASGNEAELAVTCPNCGARGGKPPLLGADAPIPGRRLSRRTLLLCRGCDARFFQERSTPDYATAVPEGNASIAYYVQQGAGLWPIVRPLTRLPHGAETRYLDVGCGFGFGLDYAVRTRGWSGRGIDPSPIAKAGRVALSLPIEHRYLAPDQARNVRSDVVMASEVLEHVADPAAFLRVLSEALAPGGLLILTTPDGRMAQPGTPAATLIPLLSAGWHVVLQTPDSLRHLLDRVGLTHVEIEQEGATLVAFASRERLALSAPDPAGYRAHLAHRMEGCAGASDAWLGFAGRAYQEAVFAGDLPIALPLFERLQQASHARYGIDFDRPQPFGPVPTLAAYARRLPFGFAPLCYARAMQRLHAGASRGELTSLFEATADAAALLNHVLAPIGAVDGMAEQVRGAALMERAQAAAEAGSPDLAERLAAVPRGLAGSRARIAGQAITQLVNAQQWSAARDLLAQFAPEMETLAARADDADAVLQAAETDAVFSLAVLDTRPGGDPQRAARSFAALRRRLAPMRGGDPHHLFWPSVTGELLATELSGVAPAPLVAAILSGLPSDVAVPPEIAQRAAAIL